MDSQRHHDSITAELAGMFGNTTQGSFTTGGFSFSESQLRTIVTNYLDLAHSYEQSMDDTIGMKMVEGPGLDFASQSFADAANRSGRSLTESFMDARDYCLEQAQLCQNALDDYLGVEHTNITEINKQGPQGPQPGV
jgi:hypothetical protein